MNFFFEEQKKKEFEEQSFMGVLGQVQDPNGQVQDLLQTVQIMLEAIELHPWPALEGTSSIRGNGAALAGVQGGWQRASCVLHRSNVHERPLITQPKGSTMPRPHLVRLHSKFLWSQHRVAL